VRHESPQILIFRRGEVVFHREHSGISEASLSEALVLLSSNGA
jgi:bacillithiol system protein YtxJ